MKAKVRPFNNYGGDGPGAVVDVEPSELARVPWCLEAVDETADQPLTNQPASDQEQPTAPAKPVADASAPTADDSTATAPKKGKKS